MKSWSERLVAGLKNWRSRKHDTEADGTSDVQSPADLSPELSGGGSKAKLSIKVTVEDFEGTGVEAIPQIEPTTALETSPVPADQMQQFEASSSQPERTHEVADEPSTSSSDSKPAQKLSRVSSPKAKVGLLTGTALAVSGGEGDIADERDESKSVLGDRKRQLDHELQKGARKEVPAKKVDEADGKASIQTEPENPSEVLVSLKGAQTAPESSNPAELPNIERVADKDAGISVVPVLLQTRPRNRKKPKATDELMTDEVLAELEAENVHLKRLLREMLSTTQDNSEN